MLLREGYCCYTAASTPFEADSDILKQTHLAEMKTYGLNEGGSPTLAPAPPLREPFLQVLLQKESTT